MAKDKRSFLLYCDIKFTVEKLTDEQAGRLFKHILSYVNDENHVMDDLIIDLVFEPIKQNLKRDLKRYEAICLRNKNNGDKGGRPKKEPKKPSGLNENPNNPDEPDNDNDNDNDIDSGNDTDKEINKRKRAPFKIPTIQEVREYFVVNGYDPDFGETRWHYYNDANWFDSHGNPVLNWKQKMRSVWFKEEYKTAGAPKLSV